MSLSKNQLKKIISLRQKKYRNEYQLFIVEGVKTVNEFLNSTFELEHLYTTKISEYKNVVFKTLISDIELKKISSLKSPNQVVAVFKIPKNKFEENDELIVALDGINDPGNLGTIIRLCDWFGVSKLICSSDTADCYNPKVVQASMGSLTRVFMEYTNLSNYLQNTKKPIYIADTRGTSVYNYSLAQNAILVMGNEANGISSNVKKQATDIISIPRFGKLQQTESLNVATATAILLSEFRRKF